MFSQADLQTIATVFGKTSEEISGAISKEEEVSLGLKLSGRVISQDEEKTLRESGVQQGKELGYKDIAKGLGLSLENGEKDPLKISEKFKSILLSELENKYKNMSPTDELIAASSKVKETEDKYKKLNETYEAACGKIKELEEKYSGLETEISNKDLNNKILSSLPEKLKIEKSDALLIFRNSIHAEKSDNGYVFKKEGKIITDAVGNPEAIENIVKSFVEEKKLIRGSGMGGDDLENKNPGKKGMTEQQAYEYIKKQNIEPASTQGLKLFKELTSK